STTSDTKRTTSEPVDVARDTVKPAEKETPVEPAPAEVKPAQTDTSQQQSFTETKKPEKEVANPPARTSAKPPKTSSTKTSSAPVDDDAEAEEVELTLTLPLAKRADTLKKFLDTHPESKARPRATELLISTHAGLGDQYLKNGDVDNGIKQLNL